MTDANYIRHLKVLGKYCKIYDDADADATAQGVLIATTSDQIATGLAIDTPAVAMHGPYISSLTAAVSSGPTALKALAVQLAGQYLSLNLFYTSLTTVPTSTTAVAALVALQTEMGAGVDNKTLTTEGSTGLVNFFDTILGSEGTWNTAGPGDYPDATYVVSAVV